MGQPWAGKKHRRTAISLITAHGSPFHYYRTATLRPSAAAVYASALCFYPSPQPAALPWTGTRNRGPHNATLGLNAGIEPPSVLEVRIVSGTR